jgi:hypothetical protein
MWRGYVKRKKLRAGYLKGIRGVLEGGAPRSIEGRAAMRPIMSAVEDLLDHFLVTGRELGPAAVKTMRSRILDPQSDHMTRQGDAHLFAMAVRQVIRFTELIRKLAPDRSLVRGAVDSALAKFAKICPQAEDTRNVLDHWDAYMRGIGEKYPAGSPDVHPRPDLVLAMNLRPATMYFQASGDSYALHVMPRIGTVLVLDVARDADAAGALTNAVCDAVAQYASPEC